MNKARVLAFKPGTKIPSLRAFCAADGDPNDTTASLREALKLVPGFHKLLGALSDQEFSAFAKENKIDEALAAKLVGRGGSNDTNGTSFAASAGRSAQRGGLRGSELDKMKMEMGTYRASTPMVPYRNERGEFVLPSTTPSEFRAIKAASRRGGAR